MQDDRDMIEINLSTTTEPVIGKGINYFGNIRLAKSHGSGFPYGQYKDNKDDDENSIIRNHNSTLCCVQFPKDDERPDRISCLRQMYCPDCQERLDEGSVLIGKNGMCCLPLFSFNRFYQNCLKRRNEHRIYCRNCGRDMGYWKRL